jgi:hypothetical protein
MKLLINQPGRHGDILICLPIAFWYTKKPYNYKVEWLCPKEYHPLFRNIDYVRPVDVEDSEYERIIDLSFGLNTDTVLHKLWMASRLTWQSFVSMKYHLAQVPISYRWNLVWNRNNEKELALYDKIIARYGDRYAVVHENTWDSQNFIGTPLSKVLFGPIDDFNIFDWYTVLLKAEEIHCIDSSLCNFVDVIPDLHSTKKFYYATAKVPAQEDRTILINNWRFV